MTVAATTTTITTSNSSTTWIATGGGAWREQWSPVLVLVLVLAVAGAGAVDTAGPWASGQRHTGGKWAPSCTHTRQSCGLRYQGLVNAVLLTMVRRWAAGAVGGCAANSAG